MVKELKRYPFLTSTQHVYEKSQQLGNLLTIVILPFNLRHFVATFSKFWAVAAGFTPLDPGMLQ